MMLERLRRALGALVVRAPAPESPQPRFDEECSSTGETRDAWIGRRRVRGWSYVDLGAEHVDAITARFKARTESTIAAADRVLRHEFDLLGSGPYRPVDREASRAGAYEPIDWLLDPVSGVRFPGGIPYKQWNLEKMRPGLADIKLPWELARCQHWLTLAQAWRLTRDDRYAREIADELYDFVRANPVGVGIHWTCTMDAAIRAANWALALDVIRSAATLPQGFWTDAYEALFDHGTFIENNLENTYEVTSNHFLSNVVGLFYLSAVFSGLPSAARWRTKTRDWLEQEMRTQVLEDGADYESSVPYHRLVTELFLGAARLGRHLGEPLADPYERRLKQMVEFLVAVIRPDGLMPQIGDADDGRLHILGEYGSWRPQDARHLLGPAAAFFHVDAWLALAGETGEWEAAWWGFAPVPAAQSIAVAAGSSHFPHAGVTVLRGGAHYAVVTNGRVGTNGFGNHKHCDQLAFEYHPHGAPLFVDPGSHVYTSDPDSRNLFRSTRSHNTLMIDDQEQNEIRPEWLFRMFEHAAPEHLRWPEHADGVEYAGRHRGYTRLDAPVAHERRIALRRSDGALQIDDHVEGSGEHQLAWHFHCAPGVTAVPVSEHRVDLAAGVVRAVLELPPGLIAKISTAGYSPSYGIRQPCIAIDATIRARIDGRRSWSFSVTPLGSP